MTRRDKLATIRFSNNVWKKVKICLNILKHDNYYHVSDALDEIMEIIETAKPSIKNHS